MLQALAIVLSEIVQAYHQFFGTQKITRILLQQTQIIPSMIYERTSIPLFMAIAYNQYPIIFAME